MSVPFEKFKVTNNAFFSGFTVRVDVQQRDAETSSEVKQNFWRDEDIRRFIESAIREKLERDRTTGGAHGD